MAWLGNVRQQARAPGADVAAGPQGAAFPTVRRLERSEAPACMPEPARDGTEARPGRGEAQPPMVAPGSARAAQSDTGVTRRTLRRVRGAMCGVSAAVAVAALAGWVLDIGALKTVLPGLTTMKANTAVGLLLLAVSLWPARGIGRGARAACGAATAVLGAATLAEYIFGARFGIDELLFADPATTSAPYHGRLSPATAAAFIGLGAASALLARGGRRGVVLAHWLTLPAAAVGALSVTGYAYGVGQLHHFGPYVSVALNTAVALCALAIATLLTRSAEGWGSRLIGRPAARAVFTRLLPASLLLPFAMGFLVLTCVRAGWFAPMFGIALFAVLTGGAFIWLAWTTAAAAARAEAARAESEARFRQLAEIMPAMVFIADARGGCTYTNATFQQFSGASADALLADGWLRLLHEQDRERAADAWWRSVADGVPHDIEIRFRRRDGVAIWHLGRSLPLRDAGGGITAWFGSWTDIQDIVAARETLSRSNEALEEMVAARTGELVQLQKMEAVGHLSGGLAHDFNNLLTPIRASLELMQLWLPADNKAAALAVEAGLQATGRAGALVQRLLAFARRQELEPKVIDAGALITGIRDMLRQSIGSAASLEVLVEPALPAIRSDANQLELAILNLAVNGRDAMPEGGTLRVEAARCDAAEPPAPGLAAGPYVCISVSDTGIGMDGETLRRAAEPFFSTKGVGKGTGLGLSMAHGLAAQSGGALTLRSAVGAGTTAQIWLPACGGLETN